MCNVFINKVQLVFGNEEGIVSLCLNDDTTGVSVEENMTKYTHRNCLLHDFSKFSGLPRSEVAGKLNKTFRGNCKGFKTEVLVSREKHFVLVYNRKQKQVTLTCNYGC